MNSIHPVHGHPAAPGLRLDEANDTGQLGLEEDVRLSIQDIAPVIGDGDLQCDGTLGIAGPPDLSMTSEVNPLLEDPGAHLLSGLEFR